MTPARYAVITPARDEAANLRRLGEALRTQTVPPAAWVVVDNGSTDETVDTVAAFADELDWVQLASARPDAAAVPGAPIVRAFHAGLELVDPTVDVVVKVDADVSMPADHFERLLGAFEHSPRLGIAGGICHELKDGDWAPVPVSGGHIRGAVRAYRRECLDDLLPLPERTGWDTIDAFQAQRAGWEIAVVPDARFDHHRPLGARDGGRTRRWRAQGDAAYYVGYRPLYLLLRAAAHSVRDPAALGLVTAFAGAALRRAPRHPDAAARQLLRDGQRLRVLCRRFARRVATPTS